jgi:ligand-binding sensor domain-containing protein
MRTDKILLIISIFFCTVFGVYAQWVKVEQLPTMYITSIARSDNAIYIAVDSCIIYKSTDRGLNWESRNFNYNEAGASSIAYLNGKIYVGTHQHGVYVSTDNGESWNNKGPAMSPVSGITEFKGKIYCSTIGDGVFVETANSWVRMNNSLPTYSTQVYTMTASPNNLLIGAGANGVWYKYDFKNAKWIEGYFYEGMAPGMEIWKMIYVEGLCYAAARNRIFSSTNEGDTWTLDFVGTKSGTDRIMYAGEKHIYALTNSNDAGILVQKRAKESPAGSSWSTDEEFVSGVYAFDILEYAGKLFLATDKGLFIKHLNNTHVDYGNFNHVRLFPNPATNDIVNLRSDEIISNIEIFDITGRIVHEEQINNSEAILSPFLSSGIYYITLYSIKGQKLIVPLIVNKY